ncbi:hypothetical protein ABW21_db0209681 [Orbilia brochopaga]|nr:hypothetical protein ABW21_db0209681 [Drechslerella brochopaga]
MMLRRLTANAVRSRRYISTQGPRYQAGLESLPPLSASSIEPPLPPPSPPLNWGQAYEKNFDESTLPDAPIPLAVRAIYHAPLRVPAPYNVPVCDLQIRSYAIKNVELFADFAMRAAFYLKIPAAGPIPLPRRTERWTVPKSVFVHKKAQQNFERVTYKRMIQLKDAHPDAVQVWLAFLRKHEYYGIGMKANVYTFEKLGAGSHFAKRLDEIKKSAEAGNADYSQQLAAMKKAFDVGHDLPQKKNQKAINHAKRVKFIAKLKPLEKAAGALEAQVNSIRSELRTEFGQELAEKRKQDAERQAKFIARLKRIDTAVRAAAATLNHTKRDLNAELGKDWRPGTQRDSEAQKSRKPKDSSGLRRLERAADTLSGGILSSKDLLASHKLKTRLDTIDHALSKAAQSRRSLVRGVTDVYGPGWRDPRHIGLLVRIQRVSDALGEADNRICEREHEMNEICGYGWRRRKEKRLKWEKKRALWAFEEQNTQVDSNITGEVQQSASSDDQPAEAPKEEQPDAGSYEGQEAPPPPQPTESEEAVAADKDLPLPSGEEVEQGKSAKETEMEEAVKKED